MHCLAGCFGLPYKAETSKECAGLSPSSPCAGKARSATGGRCAEGSSGSAEQLDWAGLVPLLTGEVPHGDWWDILQSASAALSKRLPADHASIFMSAGAGVAALTSSGVPLFGLRLGQLLLPNSSGYSSETIPSFDDSSQLRRQELDVCVLAAALQDQTASVPIAFRSVDTGMTVSKQQQQQQQQQPAAFEGSCSSKGGKGTAGSRPRGKPRDSASGVDCLGASSLRHYVAVGIPGGKSVAGIFILSATGPSPPAAWQSEGLGLVAALLAPLLRPPQVPLARRTLAELHTASTINELLHVLSAAAADLLVAAVRVAMQPRVALLRNDGTAAAMFAVHEGGGGGGGTSVCQRRSRDVVLVDAGGSGYSGIKPSDFFMLGQHSAAERDSLGTAGLGGGGGGGGGTLGKSYGGLGDQLLQRLPGGGPGAAGCRGQSLPLQHTLLSEALTRGSGLCIADCNAYVQDSKVYPRDLAVSRGSAPAQSLALATSCHCGKPLLALYATYHSILPQALLQTVVQELGQMLRALTPTVAALLLPGGPMADEWSLLHDDLLGPAAVGLGPGPGLGSSSACARQHRTSNPTAMSPLPPPSPPPPAAAAAATMAAAPPPPSSAAAAADAGAAGPRCRPRSLMVGPAGSADGDSAIGGSPNLSCVEGRSPRSSAGGPAAAAAATAAAAAAAAAAVGGGGGNPLGVVAQIGAFFRRTSAASGSSRQQNPTNGKTTHSPPAPGGAGGAAAGCGPAATSTAPPPAAAEVFITAMTAAAEQLRGVTDAATTAAAATAAAGDGAPGSSATASKRLAAFVSSGPGGPTTARATSSSTAAAATGATPATGGVSSGPSRSSFAHSHTGRTSFSLEAAGSPRGGLRLAPLISTLHDRLKSAQAEQLTASSRAASRVQDLESLRLLERVVEDLSPSGNIAHLAEGNAAAAAKSAAAAAAAAAAPVTLRAKHLHDAIELVASVSMSHPNIVQLITYFVDVKAHHHHHHQRSRLPPGPPLGADHVAAAAAAAAAAGAGGGGGGGGAADGYESDVLQLVHMTSSSSSGVNSTSSSCTEPSGNEAIVLVMEYCDRGSLKEAIQDGSFLQREALAQVQALHRQMQQQQQGGQSQAAQQQLVQQQQQAAQMLARGGVALLNMKSVYSTLLEVSLALRHMHGLHMVHCDLKPQNVLLKSSPRDPRGFTAKLSDFGLAKMMQHDDEGQLVIDDGIQSGTITHLPPEALTGCRQLGPAVDVYAFGVVMFQMLCGMTVYRGLDVKQMIRGVVREGLRPTFPAWVPTEYRDLAQRCWHEQPACRPTSLQLVSELEALLEACEGPPGWLSSRRGVGVGVGVGMGGSIGSMPPAVGGTASHRRLPSRCATETAIRMRQPAPAVGGAATVAGTATATAAAEVELRHPPFYLYQRPQQLYQPSGMEQVRSPGAAGGAAAAAAGTLKLSVAPHQPPSLYTRTAAAAAAAAAAALPAAPPSSAAATTPSANPVGVTNPGSCVGSAVAAPKRAATAPTAAASPNVAVTVTAGVADQRMQPQPSLGAPPPPRIQ
ncbi:hypothetical protein PLESTF_000494600 [Pleodorina starrii]|nr:hypothetical protein PLESTF_000494600 [Pleodorina starrii]